MPTFRYSAITPDGQRSGGTLDAPDRETALARLMSMGHTPFDLREDAPVSMPGAAADEGGPPRRKPSASQITLFTRELSMLLKAGLPLDRSLTLLHDETAPGSLRRVIAQVLSCVKGGRSLHESFAASGVFPPGFTSMVRVAEASGTLEAVLERIAQTREKEERLRGKLLSMLLYPALLLTVSVAAVVMILAFVVPRFKSMIVQAGTDTPDAAEGIIAVSDWLIANGGALAVGIVLAIAAILVLRRQAFAPPFLDTALLNTPVIGTMVRYHLTVRFCRVLGTLLENGVELLPAMDLVRTVMGNRLAVAALSQAHAAMRKGQNYLEPLSQAHIFPPVVITMLRVGDESGNLARPALFLAELYEDKLETHMRRTFTILEPVLILVVSGIVAGIIIAILGAVISINDLAL